MKLFNVDIPGIITNALKGKLFPIFIHREAITNYDPSSDTETVVTPAQTFTSEGIVEEYSDFMKAQGFVTENNRKIMILAKPLETSPKQGDIIEIEGEKITIIGTPSRDPSGSIWTIKGEV